MLDQKKLVVTTKKLTTALNKAKRSMFELETIKSAWEIKQGQSSVFLKPQDLLSKLGK